MAQLGLTEDQANAWLNTLRNVPFVAGLSTMQLHKGAPGAVATSNVSAVTTRGAVQFDEPDAGAMAMTGDSPSYSMTASETLTHVSGWTGFTGDPDAIPFATGLITVPKVVADGDTVKFGTLTVQFNQIAA